MDVMYLHGKPGSESNSQKVYDALVGAVEQINQQQFVQLHVVKLFQYQTKN